MVRQYGELLGGVSEWLGLHGLRTVPVEIPAWDIGTALGVHTWQNNGHAGYLCWIKGCSLVILRAQLMYELGEPLPVLLPPPKVLQAAVLVELACPDALERVLEVVRPVRAR